MGIVGVLEVSSDIFILPVAPGSSVSSVKVGTDSTTTSLAGSLSVSLVTCFAVSVLLDSVLLDATGNSAAVDSDWMMSTEPSAMPLPGGTSVANGTCNVSSSVGVLGGGVEMGEGTF